MKTQILKFVCTIVFAILVSSQLVAQRAANEIVEYLKPALDTQTVGILNIDLNRFRPSDLLDQFSSNNDQSAVHKELEQLSRHLDTGFDALKTAGATELNYVFKLGTFVPENRMVVIHCDQNAQKVADLIKNRHGELFGLSPTIAVKRNLVFIAHSDSGIDWVRHIEKPPTWLKLHADADVQKLSKALSQAGDAPIRFAFALTDDQKRALVELNPKTFADGKAGSPSSIENLDFVTASLDPKNEFSLSIHATSEISAKEINAKLLKSIFALGSLPKIKTNLPELSKWMQNLSLLNRIKSDSRISFSLKDDQFKDAITAVSAPVRQLLRKHAYDKSIAKLRTIIVAMHNYHDVNGHLPPAYSTDENGNPLLSWRVLILPYVDQSLYAKFNLDEPWDSANNKPLSETIPGFYVTPGTGFKSRYLVTTGGGALKESTDPKSLSLREITDGASNTIAVVEAAPSAAVIWTKPEDLPIASDGLKAKLIEEGDLGFLAVTCDCAPHFIPADVDVEVLKKLMLANDGETIDLPGANSGLKNDPKETKRDPNFDPLGELPGFWFEQLIPTPWIVSGSGG